MARSILAIGRTQARQRTIRIDVRAGHVNGTDYRHRRNVGIKKGRTHNRRDQIRIAIARDRRSAAVSDAKRRDTLLARALHCFNRVSQTLAKTDRDQHVFRRQHLNLVLQVPTTPDRRLSIETEREQSIREVIRKRRSEIQTDHQHVTRTLDDPREFDHLLLVEIALENVEIVECLIKRLVHVIRNAALLARRRFQHRVRRDARDEVLPQRSRKLRKTLVTENLRGAQNGGRINVITLCHLA